MTEQLTAATFQIQIAGQPLPPEVELVHAVIEDSLHRPDSFELELRDIDRGLLERAGIEIGAKVVVGVVGDAYPSPKTLIEGEITALEAEIDSGLNVTILRGYDQSHRLLRGRSTKSFQNVSISDVATRVAQDAGLVKGKIESTKTVIEHIGQYNQTDWDFIAGLARQVGFEFTVSNSKFNFGPPQAASSAPVGGNLSAESARGLLLGSTLLRLRAGVSSAGQVKEVRVRGWDMKAKQAVVGTAQSQTKTVDIGATPGALAAKFSPRPMVATEIPFDNLAQASDYAASVAEEVASGFAELEGVARGNPELKAGVAVSVGLVGKPFDGKYVLTSCRHVYDRHEGYLTQFSVSGRSDRSLYALTGGAGNESAIDGVVIGIVDDVGDPEDQCRVRLRFPWLSDDYVSGWARTVHVGAGPKRGLIVMPEVGDEVLVSFDRGDVRHPFVLGGLFNGKDKPDLGSFRLMDGSTHAIDARRFVSRQGHSMTFSDAANKEKVLIASADGQFCVDIDISDKTIKINSAGKIELTSTGDTTIESKGKLVLKGNQVEVEAQTNLTAKGSIVGIQAQASLEAKASGSVTIQGALVKIN